MNEIIKVENWQNVWVDGQSGMPYTMALTGTPTQPFPNVVMHYIQLGYKRLHKIDGGEIISKTDTRWETSTAYHKHWDECSTCSKHFNETDYE